MDIHIGPTQTELNFQNLRDQLSVRLIHTLSEPSSQTKRTRRIARKGRKMPIEIAKAKLQVANTIDAGESNHYNELADFAEYLAMEIFESLPEPMKSLGPEPLVQEPDLEASCCDTMAEEAVDRAVTSLPASVHDTLVAYQVVDNIAESYIFLHQLLSEYIVAPYAESRHEETCATKACACELCDRSWIPLTQHHLVPRKVADKAVKRGWVGDSETKNLAWLCRACHSFVHRSTSHEELARNFRSVESLLEREDVIKFVHWIGRVRWMSR